MQADHDQVLKRLKTARGQLAGIIKMVEGDQYCVDISNQILATEALLRSTNKLILHAHLSHCVLESMNADEKEREEKIEEIKKLLDKLLK